MIKEYYKTDKSSSSSNDSSDSIKRRRNGDANAGKIEDYEFTKSTDRSKKRATNRQNINAEACNSVEPDYHNQFANNDLDFEDEDFEIDGSEMKTSDKDGGGRVLPTW